MSWLSRPRRRGALALAVLALLLAVAGACDPTAAAPVRPGVDTYISSSEPSAAPHDDGFLYLSTSPQTRTGLLRFRAPKAPDGSYSGTLSLTTIDAGKNLSVHTSSRFSNRTTYQTRPTIGPAVGRLPWTEAGRSHTISLTGVRVADGVVHLAVTTSSPGQLRILSTEGARWIQALAAAPLLRLSTGGGTTTTTRPTTTTTRPTTTTTRPTTTTTRPTTTTTAPPSTSRQYPWHTGIVATTFWVGELFDASAEDGSQVCSTYDASWAYHWSGIRTGTVPSSAPGCPGSPTGGCDGVVRAGACATERRTAANGYFPTSVTPRENPFYLDLPYDDLNDSVGFRDRCRNIPWAGDPGYAGRCTDRSFSYMKNRWVELVGPNGATCYGQIQDAGPNVYRDAAYVFGATDARPASTAYNGAGMDVSPALNGCLGFASLDGASDRVSWRFVEAADVPSGPWRRVVTTSPVDNG